MVGTRGDRPDGARASFGYHVRRRRLALDLTQAALARRVGCSTATVKKLEHDARRPSRTMAQRLAEALELPEAERKRFVAAALGQRSPAGLADHSADPPPTWSSPSVDAADTPPIAGRGEELAALQAHLERARAGGGGVVFVAGEAGEGKTTLLSAFAAQALATDPALVVARGAGTAASGVGDPYGPFRDVLEMLLLDRRATWRSPEVTTGELARLTSFAPYVATTLVGDGPDLVGSVVTPRSVRERLPDAAAESGAERRAGASRDQVMSQLSAVLSALSERAPVVLLLDDLQWADGASIDLLFHLSRRLKRSRILVVAAYRTSDITTADATSPARAALRRTVLETTRAAEVPVIVDLDVADRARLCSAVLTRHQVELDQVSAGRMTALTGGQPLFIVELLRELQQRGALVREGDGPWRPRGDLDWAGIPARVGAVIDQRLDRLTPLARTVLDTAAVVGERFTAEVVAAVADVDQATVIRLVSGELATEHRLVREPSGAAPGGSPPSGFAFGHALFRQYLYEQLGDAERRWLHGRAATALAELYGDDAEVAAVAHHFTASGDAAAAVDPLLRAGDRARDVYANDEAAHHYEQAVAFLEQLGDPDRLSRALMKLGLTYQLGFAHARAQAAYDRAFALMGRSAARGGTASATLRTVWEEPRTLDPCLGGTDLAAPLASQLFSGLVTYGVDLEVLPDLAARWDLRDEGRRYVFQLREGLSWSDGTPLTAHDVVASYRRALHPETGAATASSLLQAVRGAPQVAAGADPDAAELGLSAPDDLTVIIDLDAPTAYFIHNLAYYVLAPVPRHLVAVDPTGWATAAPVVGSGPFRVVGWSPGDELLLARNPWFHGSVTGNVDEIRLSLETEPRSVVARYQAGRLDVVSDWFISSRDLRPLVVSRPDDVTVEPQFVTLYYLIGDRPPLDDPSVRRALSQAIDRMALTQIRGVGDEPAMGGLVPPGMPGHVPDLQPPVDPEAARSTLAEHAAAPTGLTIGIHPGQEPFAQVLVDAWQAIGIDCHVQRLDAGTWPAQHERDGIDVTFGGWWADYPDPDNFLRVCVGLELPGLMDGDYRHLLDEAGGAVRQEVRLDRYADAERWLAQHAQMVPLLYRRGLLVRRPWVHNYVTLKVKHPGFWKDVVLVPH